MNINKRPDDIRTAFLALREICPGCGASVDLYFPEGVHIFYGQIDRCTRCDRFPDEHGGPVMCMTTISLGDGDDNGEEDADQPEGKVTDYAV